MNSRAAVVALLVLLVLAALWLFGRAGRAGFASTFTIGGAHSAAVAAGGTVGLACPASEIARIGPGYAANLQTGSPRTWALAPPDLATLNNQLSSTRAPRFTYLPRSFSQPRGDVLSFVYRCPPVPGDPE